MPEQTPEARIRDLERRLDLDPGSRLFVSLAEEYRKVGRVKDALSALQKGLLAHPGYVAAQVALGRVYVEAKLSTDAIATFTKVLQADPGNLVAARSLADIYYERGDNLEALKKYKLYRALSGDRKVDPLIAKIEPKVAPLPITPLKKIINTAEPPPPPPSFQDTQVARSRPTMTRLPVPAPELSDPFDVTSLAFDPGEDSTGKGAAPSDGPFSAVPTRDVFIAPAKNPRAAAAPAPAKPPEPSPPEPDFEPAPAVAPEMAAPPVPPAEHEPAVETPSSPPAPFAAAAPTPGPPTSGPIAEPRMATPPPEMDPEETLSVRPAPVDAAAPEEDGVAGDMFADSRPELDLPEPPALFLAATPAASAGEVRVEAASLEPRQFPPPYDGEPSESASSDAGASEAPGFHEPDAPAAFAVEPVFPGDVPAEPAAAAPFHFASDDEPTGSEEALVPDALPHPAPSEGAAAPEPPTGRALADLYYAQGHYAEALQIYDDLVTRHPFDDDLKRMRRDAEARLLPAASVPSASAQDLGLERRLARVRVLKRWLGRIQSSDRAAAPPGP